MYNIGDVFYFDDKYAERANFCNNNKLIIVELESDHNGRRFQIQQIPELTEDEILCNLRHDREYECFSVINRGALWYQNLTVEEYIELQDWYHKWLDVTKSRVVPEKPVWIK